jgi:serpin B
MKKTSKVIATLAAAVLVLAFSSCTRKHSVSPTSPPPPVNDNTYTPAQADNLLTFDLYNWYKSDSDNVFFSPFSIITALAMAQEGAKGQTAYEMQKVLYLRANDTERRESFQQLIADINAPGKKFQLTTSNHLWVEQTFQLLQPYIDVCGQYYSASVTNLDFIGNPGGSAQTINDTVSNETNGKITDLIPPDAITAATRLILTNAIYFKADWLDQFAAEDTNLQDFHLNASQTVPVSMMHQNTWGKIEDYHGTAQVLDKPYVDREVSMFIFLPPQGGMAALEGQMTGDKLNGWFASRTAPTAGATIVALSLPKFTYKTSYQLVATLKQMGMNAAFDPSQADFSGMDGNRDLYITDVLHKAFVAVDEEGTEAAAATGVVIGVTSVPPPPVPFTVDRPFIFILYENSANAVLFMGKVNDPTQN